MQRRVAEQHVQKLAGIRADRRGGQPDADLEQVFSVGRASCLDLSDELVEDEAVVDCRDRHFHALLDRDGAGALRDRRGVGAHVIDRREPGHASSDQDIQPMAR